MNNFYLRRCHSVSALHALEIDRCLPCMNCFRCSFSWRPRDSHPNRTRWELLHKQLSFHFTVLHANDHSVFNRLVAALHLLLRGRCVCMCVTKVDCTKTVKAIEPWNLGSNDRSWPPPCLQYREWRRQLVPLGTRWCEGMERTAWKCVRCGSRM